jgi:hypothetical protein
MRGDDELAMGRIKPNDIEFPGAHWDSRRALCPNSFGFWRETWPGTSRRSSGSRVRWMPGPRTYRSTSTSLGCFSPRRPPTPRSRRSIARSGLRRPPLSGHRRPRAGTAGPDDRGGHRGGRRDRACRAAGLAIGWRASTPTCRASRSSPQSTCSGSDPIASGAESARLVVAELSTHLGRAARP